MPHYTANGHICLRDLKGDEKMRMFEGLCFSDFNLKKTFVNSLAIDNIDNIHAVWSSFVIIYKLVKDNEYLESDRESLVNSIKSMCFEWLTLFLNCYHEDQVS
jgi:hypothetical protein